MAEEAFHRRRAVPWLPDLDVAGPADGLEQRPPLFAAGGGAMREQQAQRRMLRAQRLEQHGGGAGFAQRHGMHPDQFGGRFSRLGVMAEAFAHGFEIAGFLLPTARQFAAQQGLAERHEHGIQTTRPIAHAATVFAAAPATLHASQACQTTSTPGEGWANTLTCRLVASFGPVRQAVSKL